MPTPRRFEFKKYDASELKAAGVEFANAFKAQQDAFNAVRFGTREWTHCILDWFCNAAPSGVRVDATGYTVGKGVRASSAKKSLLRTIAGGSRKKTKEFMVDLCHSSWPPDTEWPKEKKQEAHERWQIALKNQPVMHLALESEMGKEASGTANINAIMEDATKLLHIAARTKVVVVASRNEGERVQLEGLSAALSKADRTAVRWEKKDIQPSWLWIDLPWAVWDQKLGPHSWIAKS